MLPTERESERAGGRERGVARLDSAQWRRMTRTEAALCCGVTRRRGAALAVGTRGRTRAARNGAATNRECRRASSVRECCAASFVVR